jgi:hypothetical protein
MRHYRTSDSPSFRLVLNAAQDLVDAAPSSAPTQSTAADLPEGRSVAASLRSQLVRRGTTDELLTPVIEDVASSLAARLDRAAPALDGAARRLAHDARSLGAVWAHLAVAIEAAARSNAEKTLSQVLMEVELGVCLMETWTRAAVAEAAPVEVP